MIKREQLKDGMVLVLLADVINKHPDRRVKYDWRDWSMLEKGTKFVVRENGEGAHKRFALERRGDAYASLHRLSVNESPYNNYDNDDYHYFLAVDILANAEEPAMTAGDFFHVNRIEHNAFAGIVRVLLAQGIVSRHDILQAHNKWVCPECNKVNLNTEHCSCGAPNDGE